MVMHLYNDGRNVIITFAGRRIQYLGPKNLLHFHRINRIEEDVLYVDCYFSSPEGTVYSEEDYIDLKDVLGEYGSTLQNRYKVIVGNPDESERESLISKSLLVSDNLAILFINNQDIPDKCVQVISLSRPRENSIIRLKDCAVVSSNMSKALLKRSIEAVKRNTEEIKGKID